MATPRRATDLPKGDPARPLGPPPNVGSGVSLPLPMATFRNCGKLTVTCGTCGAKAKIDTDGVSVSVPAECPTCGGNRFNYSFA